MFRAFFFASSVLIGTVSIVGSEPIRTSMLNPQAPSTQDFTIKVEGFGSCGQFCRTTSGQTWNCDPRQRPVYQDDGGCRCEWFSECN
jgi:hypothetical protein